MNEIPEDLINFGIKYVPVTSWTMEQEGVKYAEVVAKDDKWQITVVFAASLSYRGVFASIACISR